MQIHHMGIIVSSIEKTLEDFTIMGFHPSSDFIYDKYQNIYIQFVETPLNQRIELIETGEGDSSIGGTRIGVHHICLEELSESEKEGLVKNARFLRVEIAPALNYLHAEFYITRTGVLIEII